MKHLRDLAIDWQSADAMAEAVCQVILLVESFNAFTADKVIKQPAESFSTKGLLLDFRRFIAASQSWPRWVELSNLLRSVNRLPPFNDELLDCVVALILRPARILPQGDGHWKISGTAGLPRIPVPVRLEEQVALIDVGTTMGFATRSTGGEETSDQHKLGRLQGWYWDQVLDPVWVCHSVLMEICPGKRSVPRAEFFLQKSLRRYFRLRYSNEMKYLFAKIAARFNETFYHTATPRFEEVQRVRSATVSGNVLLQDLTSLLKPLWTDKNDLTLLNAIGLSLFARFCRVLRVRYFLLSPIPNETDEERARARGQCLSALRRLEYGYFLNRVFGSISEMPGLNFVFRGGILPRTNTGRVFVATGPPGSGKTVFALEKLAGVAARGGLAIYFSFEERVDLLVDRLVTFDFLEGNHFDVVIAGDDLRAKITQKRDGERGALVLFNLGHGRGFPMLELIRNAGQWAEGWRWRALAIDSINALQIGEYDRPASGRPPTDRLVARELIEAIEDAGFLGVIVSEESAAQVEGLEYVADTVLQFGFGQGDRSRWMEVRKCRSQNYHAGRHQIRLIEGRGMSVIPSLGAIRSALRRRTKSTLSVERVIMLAPFFRTVNGPAELAEKCVLLVYGPHGAGKTLALLRLATEPTHVEGKVKGREYPRSVLVLNFKTTEARFYRVTSMNPDIARRWSSLRTGRVRWFSPGETLTGDEVVWEIWQSIQTARRSGLPIDRIIFDEIENAEVALPGVANEPLFWTTLLQLIGSEAITALLGFSLEDGAASPGVLNILKSEADYVVKICRSVGDGRLGNETRETAEITMEKYPDEMRRNGNTTQFRPEGHDQSISVEENASADEERE